MKRLIFLFSVYIVFNPLTAFAAVSDFLILRDIDNYRLITQKKDMLTGKILDAQGYIIWRNPGIFAEASHFGLDHKDITYETSYDKGGSIIDVQITQHQGSESDRWLLHEMEDRFRSENDLNLTYVSKNPLTDVDGNWIWHTKDRYEWLSDYTVISIQVANPTDIEIEPLDLLKAYLKKFPSTISLTPDKIGRVSHTLKWLSDEMERRLWLCEKWLEQGEKSKTGHKNVLYEATKNIEIFLTYQHKYYKSDITENEKSLLKGYIDQNNESALMSKVKTYKNWLQANR